MTIEQWGFFSVPHLLRHVASVYTGHLWGPITLTPIAERLAMELSLPAFTTGLLQLGFTHPIFSLGGKCSNPLRYHRVWAIDTCMLQVNLGLALNLPGYLLLCWDCRRGWGSAAIGRCLGSESDSRRPDSGSYPGALCWIYQDVPVPLSGSLVIQWSVSVLKIYFNTWIFWIWYIHYTLHNSDWWKQTEKTRTVLLGPPAGLNK